MKHWRIEIIAFRQRTIRGTRQPPPIVTHSRKERRVSSRLQGLYESFTYRFRLFLSRFVFRKYDKS